MSIRSNSPADTTAGTAKVKRDRTHWLYIAVIIAVVAGVIVGLVAPEVGKDVGVLGTMFVSLIKMMIAPVIFCTIVLGIGSVRKAATVGKVGGLAFVYFLAMSTVALAIGLLVGNLIQPGEGLNITATASKGAALAEKAHESGGTMAFIEGIIPTSLLSSLTEGNVLQALFVALLVGFAIQAMGRTGEPILVAVSYFQKLVFKILTMVLWVAPIGAFGAIANVVGQTGWAAVQQLAILMLAFYLTCVVFVFGVLGVLLRWVAGVSILRNDQDLWIREGVPSRKYDPGSHLIKSALQRWRKGTPRAHGSQLQRRFQPGWRGPLHPRSDRPRRCSADARRGIARRGRRLHRPVHRSGR